MIFTTKTYSRLELRLKQKYHREVAALLKTIKRDHSTPLLAWLNANNTILKDYTPVKWLFLQQIKNFLWFRDYLPALSHDPEEFSPADDEVFEKWNASEFADVFLKAINKNKGVQFATEVALQHLEDHLITFGLRQLFREDAIHPSYRVQTSIGEYAKGKKIQRLLETTLHLEGKDLVLMTSSIKEMKQFSLRIEIALKVIRKFNPGAWDRFKAFTTVIIPISQSEFVSYSHQELPGYSMINLYDRDFVDLMDDLLHENGHHHLNYYLNLGKVIDEPQDLIYYSPWRRTMRPLRGIYHAFFTFYWAFDLFSSIASSKEMDSIFYLFTDREKEKIYWRAVEEYYMLDYTYIDLQRAYRAGLITNVGWEFIQEQRKSLLKAKKKVAAWEKQIKSYKTELKELKRLKSKQ